MGVSKTLFINQYIFCLIIFSITCFGKEFDELFTIYVPIDNASKIEKSINSSFNIMIYRLTGDSSPSNIWKIINAGNARKDFIKSYSIKNINNDSYLQVFFDKDLLIKKFNELSIPALGNSRPTVLFLINIDNGSSKPYTLKESQSISDIDRLIKNSLKIFSNSRAIFLELPELDLSDIDTLSSYSKLINSNDFLNSKYESTKVIEINIIKVGLDNWQVNGDITFEYKDNDFNNYFIERFEKYVVNTIDQLLDKNVIETSEETITNINISNINNYDDYMTSKETLKKLVSI
ncbi:MAG: DUF2066 domain-containing protein, partial [Gammaproteobacteria bacterium]